MSLQTRLAPLISALGADYKSLQAQINALGGGGGSDPWTVQAVTTAQSTTSTSTPLEPFSGFTPVANTRYIVDILAMVQSAATTTGVQSALSGPTTGITRSAVKVVSASAATTDKIDHLALNAFQVATAGLTTPNLLMLQAIIDVGASPGAGLIRAQFKTEVSGSSITIQPGSTMRWRTI